MRTAISFVVGIITAAVVVAVGVLVAQNGQTEKFSFMGAPFQGAMGWLTAGAVAAGFLLAFLVLVPGRLASSWQAWTQGRRRQDVEQQLQALRQQYAELQGSHWSLLEEHRHLMSQVLTPAAAGHVQPSSASVASAVVPATAATMQRPQNAPIVMPPQARQPSVKAQLSSRRDTPIDRLRVRIAELRVALAAKLAGLKRSVARNLTTKPNNSPTSPSGPTAMS